MNNSLCVNILHWPLLIDPCSESTTVGLWVLHLFLTSKVLLLSLKKNIIIEGLAS